VSPMIASTHSLKTRPSSFFIIVVVPIRRPRATPSAWSRHAGQPGAEPARRDHADGVARGRL